MVVAHPTKLSRPALLLACLVVSAGVLERDVCRAQTAAKHSAPRESPSARLVADGVAALERGDAQQARDFFQKALGLNPGDVAAHTYLGALADRGGDLKEAERHFASAARLAPSSATARNNYGAILMRTGRTGEAAAEFEASLRADARQPSALVNLAQIRFAGGSPEDLRAADELFARAYEIAPDAEIARALTVIALRREDRAAAAAHYRDYAARVARGGGTTAANSAAARAELGGALLEAGLLDEAEAELLAAFDFDPSNAEAVVRLARVHLARQDLPAAGRTLEAAVARGLDAAPVYALLAEVYEQSGHLENAIPAMRLAIQRDPTSEKYRFAYGILLTNAYAPAAAIIRLEEALKSFPTSSRLWFALGLAHFKHGKDDEAARALKRATELDPKFAPAFAYLGMTRVKVGAYGEGVALYEDALRVDPTLAVVHYLIADALLKQVDADTARIESHLKRAVEMDATFAPAQLALAKLYMRAERWAEAAAELEKVTRLDPSLAEAHYQLGRAYGRLKRTSEAQTALATFKHLSETQKEQERKELTEIMTRLGNVRF